jgi:hypothetical protein
MGWNSLQKNYVSDALTIRYGELPSNFPLKCDGCDAHFTLQHALGCKKGGLVIVWHNEVQDELAHLAAKAFTPQQYATNPSFALAALLRTRKVWFPREPANRIQPLKKQPPKTKEGMIS